MLQLCRTEEVIVGKMIVTWMGDLSLHAGGVSRNYVNSPSLGRDHFDRS
jgi:hypothetical protein